MTVHVAIGNSDDRLTQVEWSHFYWSVDGAIRDYAVEIHGAWRSDSVGCWQNACWGFDLDGDPARERNLRRRLARIASAHQQDSIAWNSSQTEMIVGRRRT